MENQKEKVVYHPVPYIAFVFIITWICAVLLSYSQYIPWQPVLILLDFIESASPLFVSMYLLRKYLNKHFLWKFFFGKKITSSLGSPMCRGCLGSLASPLLFSAR